MIPVPPNGGAARHRPVLVVDLGAQYAQLIARRIRQAGVFSLIVSRDIGVEEARRHQPLGLVLSGGPLSVYSDDAYLIDPGLLEMGVPVLGICYGHQLLAHLLGGTVEHTGEAEYGRTSLDATGDSLLLAGTPARQDVWMSHMDAVTEPPHGFAGVATTPGSPVAAMENPERGFYGVQFHPEVIHTDHGFDVMERFVRDACGAAQDWTGGSIITEQVGAIRARVGDARVVCGLSGGVDSAVAAALVHRAVGDRLTCVFVDHGLLRAGEAEQVDETFRRNFEVDLVRVDAADRFLNALAGVSDPERKRRIIGELFIRTFEEATAGIPGRPVPGPGHPLSGCHRVGWRLRRHDQDPPQRGRAPRQPRFRAHRAASGSVQGRGPGRGGGVGASRGDRVAPAVPWSRPGGARDRRDHPGAAGAPSRRRRHRYRGDPPRRGSTGRYGSRSRCYPT